MSKKVITFFFAFVFLILSIILIKENIFMNKQSNEQISIIENKNFFGNDSYTVFFSNGNYTIFDINNKTNYELFLQQIPNNFTNFIEPKILINNTLFFTYSNNYNQQMIYSIDLSNGELKELSSPKFNGSRLMGLDMVFGFNLDTYFTSSSNMKKFNILMYKDDILKLYPTYIEYKNNIIIDNCITEVGYNIINDKLFFYSSDMEICCYSFETNTTQVVLKDIITNKFVVTNEEQIYFNNLSDNSNLYKYDIINNRTEKISSNLAENLQTDGENIYFLQNEYICTYENEIKRICEKSDDTWYVCNHKIIYSDFSYNNINIINNY